MKKKHRYSIKQSEKSGLTWKRCSGSDTAKVFSSVHDEMQENKNLKLEIDNMFQGYWQTTVGVEIKGKILGLIGLGKVGSQVAKLQKHLICRLWHGVKI